MITLTAIRARAIAFIRSPFNADPDDRPAARHPDGPSAVQMEIAMRGMSDEDARWYYERLRWRA